jgi:hypothetical protein
MYTLPLLAFCSVDGRFATACVPFSVYLFCAVLDEHMSQHVATEWNIIMSKAETLLMNCFTKTTNHNSEQSRRPKMQPATSSSIKSVRVHIVLFLAVHMT